MKLRASAPLDSEQKRLTAWIADCVPGAARTALCLVLVLITSWCMYFKGYSEPKHLFWDENYHVTSAQRYIDGIAHLEPHPPLGLLLIAAGEKLSGTNAGIDKSALLAKKFIDGNALPNGFSFKGMRLVPSLFATLGALLFFGLVLELTGHRLHALLFSSLYLFENAYIVHFRAVHLDSIQMFFCLGALWMFVRMWKQSAELHWRQYAGMAALCGLAIMVKINAALLLILFPVIYFRDAGPRSRGLHIAAQARHFLLKSGVSVAAVLAIVLTVFTLHLLVAPKPVREFEPAGQTDTQFMSPTYKAFLAGERNFSTSVLLKATGDYFRFMDHDHKGVPKLDICKPGENGAPPLSWPLHNKAINYRWDSANGFTRYVQLAGNQLSWYLGLAAVLLSILTIANRRLFKMNVGSSRAYPLIEVFTGLYVVFMLLHLYLGAQRVMYLYHYFLGLLISYILLVLNWQQLCDLHELRERTKTWIAAGMALMILASCIFFLPLSHYQPLSKQQCERRNIFLNLVYCQG